MRDPYQVLGVDRDASAEAIKAAYRKLAKKLHPDVNPGRKDIEQKFKEVTAAYDLLSDPAKRARFDRGEIDAMGNERGFSRGPGGGSGSSHRRRSATFEEGDFFGGGESPESFFAEFFNRAHGAGGRAHGGGAPPRGEDKTYTLSVPFVEACRGGSRRVTLENHRTLDVTIPPGTATGHKLRLRGLGAAGPGGPGDARIEIQVEPHPFFTRKQDDLHLEAPVSLPEAVLGASITVPTLDGQVAVRVPKGASSGALLRLRGKGVPRPGGEPGDMFVKLVIVLPESPDAELEDLLERWSRKHAYDPRRKLGWG